MADKLRAAEPVTPYTALAAGYDFVMSHVNYQMWAEYVQDLLERHQPDTSSILELGCGTGSFAIVLQPTGPYDYLGTDASEDMLGIAREKARAAGAEIEFATADFSDYEVDSQVDAILLLYDGLNYLLEVRAVRSLLSSTFAALEKGGIFIVDQSTPANSINNEPYFESTDCRDGFSYVRRSRYDASSRLHRTTLEISIGDEHFREEHVQRAYAIQEARALIEDVGFVVEAVYDGFSTEPASGRSERVHWVLRRPTECGDDAANFDDGLTLRVDVIE